MSLLQKIKLSLRYGKVLYIISLIVTLSASGLVMIDPDMRDGCIVLKPVSIAILLYLFASLQKGQKIYFYLNLGISRAEYYAIPVVVEFIFFIICMIVSSLTGYAIR